MSEELRTAVLAAIAGDGATLVEIHERTGEDSRRTLAMLHALAGQKIATCAREEGRGMVWSLTDDAAANAPDVAPPPAPTVRRIEGAPAGERQNPSPPIRRAILRSPRPAESNASVVLRFIAEQQRPVLVREIIAGVEIAPQSVYNTLTDLTRAGRVVKGGLPMRTTYSVPNACELQPEIVVNITRAIEKAAPQLPEPRAPDAPAALPPGEIIVSPTRRALLVAVTVRVPIDKASAVCRAIEQALA
jgi:hypothetical protein